MLLFLLKHILSSALHSRVLQQLYTTCDTKMLNFENFLFIPPRQQTLYMFFCCLLHALQILSLLKVVIFVLLICS